jgi:RNA polymerase sigma factor (sigma-70 family)
MILHISFKAESAKTPDVERDIQQYVKKLERFLTAFRPDLVHLHAGIDHHPRERYTVSLNLRLPTGQLATQENGPALTPAIRVSFAELISQLKRHKQLIRNEHRWRRDRRYEVSPVAELQENVEEFVSRRTGPGPQPLATAPADRSGSEPLPNISSDAFVYGNLFRADVRNYIDGNLQRLERFVEREIRFREEEGSLQPDLVTPVEVLDEVVVNALSADEPPANMSTVRWIYRLALDAIDHLASSANGDPSAMKLEEPVGVPNVSGTDEDYLQYHEPGETHNREDFLPNQQAETPEDSAANGEMMDQFEDALRGVPTDQRQAFVLFTIEGFTSNEVAQIMDRGPEQVKELITAAREQVVKKLPPSNALKQRLINRSNVA